MKAEPISLRIMDALREMGVLLMALAPLDGSFNPASKTSEIFGFVILGAIFFVASLNLEDMLND